MNGAPKSAIETWTDGLGPWGPCGTTDIDLWVSSVIKNMISSIVMIASKASLSFDQFSKSMADPRLLLGWLADSNQAQRDIEESIKTLHEPAIPPLSYLW